MRHRALLAQATPLQREIWQAIAIMLMTVGVQQVISLTAATHHVNSALLERTAQDGAAAPVLLALQVQQRQDLARHHVFAISDTLVMLQWERVPPVLGVRNNFKLEMD
jgi:ABC-type phosphate transport system auxiliary subunit